MRPTPPKKIPKEARLSIFSPPKLTSSAIIKLGNLELPTFQKEITQVSKYSLKNSLQ